MSSKLTPRQLRDLRGQGHKLKALVRIGKDGINEAVIAAVNRALSDHELVKVKLIQGCLLDKDAAAQTLAKDTRSILVQRIGRTSLLFREKPPEKKQEKKPSGKPEKKPAGKPGRKPGRKPLRKDR